MIEKLKQYVNGRAIQFMEIVLLFVSFVLPHLVDAANLFLPYLAKTDPDPENISSYIVIKNGNWAISIALFIFSIIQIRKYNREQVMNRTHHYFSYRYSWYWFCSKILGYEKCDLALVPVYMQFALIINGVFKEYPLCDEDFPEIENEKCLVKIENDANECNEINIILEDTYCIHSIPYEKREYKTIRISRTNLGASGRHFSQTFINSVISVVQNLKEKTNINVFATTNPKHSLHIARRAFRTAGRTNILHLYVFPQTKDNELNTWRFENTGYKIY